MPRTCILYAHPSTIAGCGVNTLSGLRMAREFLGLIRRV
ncbi:hypothetical protein ACKW8Q_003531, partial [Escherichia coli]